MRSRGYTLFLLIWISSVLAAAGANQPSVLERHLRPGAADEPTLVKVSAFLVDILEIDDVERTITLDYYLLQSWKDPRLADQNFRDSASKLDLTIDEIWSPEISRVNVKTTNVRNTLLNVDREGTVVYRQRRIDTFTTPLDLRRFPFDEQRVKLMFLSTAYGPDQVKIEINHERSGYNDAFSISGWSFEQFQIEQASQTVRSTAGLDQELRGFDLFLTLKRNSAFYIWKVMVPLGFIVFMAWTVFWIDPAEFGGQVAISTSSVITLIAFQLSLSELLPRISYLTEIDVYALGTSFLVFLALGESITTAKLAKNERQATARRIDAYMRWIYPLAYLLLLLFVTI
jgi:hypothetical protein